MQMIHPALDRTLGINYGMATCHLHKYRSMYEHCCYTDIVRAHASWVVTPYILVQQRG